MQCLFLFRDSKGRLPTAKDLRRCGFRVSKAALPVLDVCEECTVPADASANRERALAAELKAIYGGGPQPGGTEADARPGEGGV